MKKIFLIIISCALLASLKEKAIEDIRSYYTEEAKITERKFSIPSKAKKEIQNTVKQKFFRDKIYYWTIEHSNGTDFALMDNVIGKSMPITFVVIFDEEGKVKNSSLIKYREAYGGEVKSKTWLNQFNGMKQDSLYKFPGNIAGISGATISVNSMTRGFGKLSLLLPYIMNDYNNGK
tara:strand:+ start:1154 stop:1684 length:531 start_codon:yes stop_codon:yes gene_type:complete